MSGILSEAERSEVTALDKKRAQFREVRGPGGVQRGRT